MTGKHRFYLFVLFLSVISFTSCLKNDHEEKLDEELRLLELYLQENNITKAPTTSGLYYIENQAGDGVLPEIGDFLLFNYTGRLVSGEKIYGTSDESVALLNDLHSEYALYGPYKMQLGYISPYGVNEGLSYMSEGAVARIIFPSTLGFGASPVGVIPAYSSLIYDIEVLKVITDVVAYENAQISQYLEEYQYSALPDQNGLYYIETIAGTGNMPTETSKVEVIYNAKMIDGRLIATTGSITKSFRLDDAYVIDGLKQGIKKMKVGGTAILIVPYDLAFGELSVNDASYGYKIPIPPYSTLVFEIELKAII